jgi:signal transduction histidine kinase
MSGLTQSKFGRFGGLSGKLLGLSMLFVMLGELLIFLPSIANYRIQVMKARIAQAEIAAMAVEAAPDMLLSEELRTELLKGAGVTAVAVKKDGASRLVLRGIDESTVAARYDLRPGMYYNTVLDALAILFRTDDRTIMIQDYPPNMSGDLIEVAMREAPLRQAMLQYGLNILGLSIALSLIVAGLIYAALNRALVKPMRQLSENMVAFGARPEDVTRVIAPTGRQDEIGMAETELKSMQSQLQSMLLQKAHLAALGLAVSKVSHDLRNMLTTAQLLSDRLATVDDPTVKRFAPKLFNSLDRAITFLNETLKYGRAQEQPPRRERLPLLEIVDEVCEQMQLQAGSATRITNLVQPGIQIDADREHLNRILTNLVRNSVQAIASERDSVAGLVTITATRRTGATEIRVEDNGPGIPPAVREKLFEAFQSADRNGGTGLGLAIASELVRNHQGTIDLTSTGSRGTSFLITIPDLFPAATSNIVALPQTKTKAQT